MMLCLYSAWAVLTFGFCCLESTTLKGEAPGETIFERSFQCPPCKV